MTCTRFDLPSFSSQPARTRAWRISQPVLSCIAALWLVAAPSLGQTRSPQAVSPGHLERVSLVESRCPTFSWSAPIATTGYELMVYRLSDLLDSREPALEPEAESQSLGADETAINATPLLQERLPAGVSTFTPDLSDCFVRGEQLVWFVRSVDEDGERPTPTWSEPRAFEIAERPAIDLQDALDVVRDYLASTDGSADATASYTGTQRTGPGNQPRIQRIQYLHPVQSTVDVSTAVASIKTTAANALEHGVIASTSAVGAAGLVAANTNAGGGADLILSGFDHGNTSALFTEASLQRNSAAAEVFDFDNTGAGSMTLTISGEPVVATETACANGEFPRSDGVGGYDCATTGLSLPFSDAIADPLPALDIDNSGGDVFHVGNAGTPTTTINSPSADGLEVEGAAGDGVFVGRADVHGVHVTEAGSEGVRIGKAGAPPKVGAVDAKSGVAVDGAEGSGVSIGYADMHGVHVTEAKDYGLLIDKAGVPSATPPIAGVGGVGIIGSAGEGVAIGRADGIGVAIVSAGVHGLAIGDAGMKGIEIGATGDDAIAVTMAGGHGLEITSAGLTGVKIDSATADGVLVGSAVNGVKVTAAAMAGIRVEDPGGVTGTVHGVSVDGPTNGFHVGAADVGLKVDFAGDKGIEILEVDGSGIVVDGGIGLTGGGGEGLRVLDATKNAVHIVKTTDPDFIGPLVAHGLYVEDAATDGLHIKGAGELAASFGGKVMIIADPTYGDAGDLELTGDLTLGGMMLGDVGITGHLDVGLGQSDIDGDLNVDGDLSVGGTLSKGSGTFKIDHPLDPDNRYLYHSFVESPEMLNIYNGTVRLDRRGSASVEMPDWFEALNRTFRYQLTPLGSPAPDLHIAGELTQRRFLIAGGKPHQTVSWQVTGVRQDPYAEHNRVQVEEWKAPADRGRYLHPEAYGQPETRRIGTARSTPADSR